MGYGVDVAASNSSPQQLSAQFNAATTINFGNGTIDTPASFYTVPSQTSSAASAAGPGAGLSQTAPGGLAGDPNKILIYVSIGIGVISLLLGGAILLTKRA